MGTWSKYIIYMTYALTELRSMYNEHMIQRKPQAYFILTDKWEKHLTRL